MGSGSSQFHYRLTAPQPGMQLGDFKRCLYCVSINDNGTSVETLTAGLAWVRSHFRDTAVLFGDSLFRLTMMMRPLSGAGDIEREAKDFAENAIAEFMAVVQQAPAVIRTSEVQTWETYRAALDCIDESFRSNGQFRESLIGSAQKYVSRQIAAGRINHNIEDPVSLSVKYLIEEIAIYDALAGDGWTVDAYIGSELPALSDIITGKIIGVGSHLAQRTNISLRIR